MSKRNFTAAKSNWARLPQTLLTIAIATLSSAAFADKETDAQWALLNQYCISCHNADDFNGGLAFDLMSHDSIVKDAEVWEKVVRKLRGSMMPPPGQKRPDGQKVDQFVTWLEQTLDKGAVAKNPGDKMMHRLNRTEYANAIRDLLKLDVEPATLLPTDGAEDGFDNIATALQVTPTFVDQYLGAARTISEQAVGAKTPRPSGTPYNLAAASNSMHNDGLPLGSRGGAVVEHYFPADGEYRLNIGNVVNGLAPSGLEHKQTMIATLDGKKIFSIELGGEEEAARADKLRAPVIDELAAKLRDIPLTTTAGPHKIAVFFVQRSYAESDSPLQQLGSRKGQDAIVAVRDMEVYGPVKATGMSTTPSRAKVFSCKPGRDISEVACAKKIISTLGNEAFRGMLTDTDVTLLMKMYDAGSAEGGFEKGVTFALSGILAHPKFLYRMEPVPTTQLANGAYELSSLELASRLSFFLWSSLPDETLLEIAADDRLKNPAILEQQVKRMLKDPRAKNLAENFGSQWLGLGELASITPDTQLFRDVDRNIRNDMTKETQLFLQSIFEENRSVVDLLTADHTFLNESLALHYGINDIRGSEFRRVKLKDERRFGLLGKGAILMVSSYPNRTSPVLRGKWLLEKITGTPPAAPPPNVEGFVEIEAGQDYTTVRERLEKHRAKPSCNGCHGVIDPLGFSLENFDAVGRWRDIDRMARTPIDSSGTMANGTKVGSPTALRQAILARPQQFVQTFTEKLMTFGLGRKINYRDMPTVRRIVRESSKDNYQFASLVLKIVQSEQFRMKSLPTATVAATNKE